MLALTLQSFPRFEIMPSGTENASLTAAASCNIHASGGTPCLAAIILLGLYKIFTMVRSTESHAAQTTHVANAAAQDNTCADTVCVINRLYDQSGDSNVMSRASPGASKGPYTNLTSTTGTPVTLNCPKA